MIRYITLLLGALMSFASSTTVLDSMAARTPVGGWTYIRADSLTNNMTHTGPAMDVIYAFQNQACWDKRTKQLLTVGGPHMAPMRFNIYRESTNGWRNVPLDPAWISHSYDNVTLDSVGRMCWYHATKIRIFDTDSNRWIDSLDGPPTSTRYGSLEYFPEKRGFVYVLNGSVYFCPLSTRNWRTISSGLTMGGYHNIAEYNPVHKKIYFGGGNGNTDLYELDSAMHITKLPDAPIGYGINSSLTTVDPGSGHILFIDSSGVYYYDPTTTNSGKAARSFVRFQDQAVVAAISTYGVIAFLTTDVYPFLLYKHNPAVVATEQSPLTTSQTSNRIDVQPNPFNPSVQIQLQSDAPPLSISIFNLRGKLIAHPQWHQAGTNIFRLNWNPDNTVASGTYLLQIRTTKGMTTKKLSYLR